MATKQTYAYGTTVPARKTQNEITEMFERAGAEKFGTMSAKNEQSVAFALGGKMFRIGLTVSDGTAPREIDRQWRVIYLTVKAKLVAVREGVSTIEREFLAETVMADGRTMHEWAAPQIEAMYATGRMPLPLMLEGPNPSGRKETENA